MAENDRPATIGELKATFPDDPTFALECAEKALTLAESKIAFADKTLASKPVGKAPGGKPIATAAKARTQSTDEGGGVTADDFEAAVCEVIRTSPHLTRKQAVIQAARQNPEAHQAWIDATNQKYPRRYS